MLERIPGPACTQWCDLPKALEQEAEPEKPVWGNIVETLRATVREDVELRWRELRAVEVILEEVVPEFDGEDPAAPSSGGKSRRPRSRSRRSGREWDYSVNTLTCRSLTRSFWSK